MITKCPDCGTTFSTVLEPKDGAKRRDQIPCFPCWKKRPECFGEDGPFPHGRKKRDALCSAGPEGKP
jgi:hypothetical protein